MFVSTQMIEMEYEMNLVIYVNIHFVIVHIDTFLFVRIHQIQLNEHEVTLFANLLLIEFRENRIHVNVNHVIKHQIQLFDVGIEFVDVYKFVIHFHIDFYHVLIFEFQFEVKQLILFQNYY